MSVRRRILTNRDYDDGSWDAIDVVGDNLIWHGLDVGLGLEFSFPCDDEFAAARFAEKGRAFDRSKLK